MSARRLVVTWWALVFGAATGCSLVTDFDRFQGSDACAGVTIPVCRVGVPASDGTCGIELEPTGTACEQPAGVGCSAGAGTCNAAGECEAPPVPAGTRCEVEASGCFGTDGACDGAGVCISEPLPVGSACTLSDMLCMVPECDGTGGCGRPAFEANDGCAAAAPLLPNTDPGPKPAITLECLRDDGDTSCGPSGAPDAFFDVELPLPRWLRIDLRRPDGPLARPGAVSVSESCMRGDEILCATVGGDAFFEGWFVPGSYRVAVEVASRVGGPVPPEFEVRTLVDPQNDCNTAPTLFAPPPGGVDFYQASTVGADDEFQGVGLGLTRDHVYEIVVETAGRVLFETFPIPDDELAPGEANLADTVLSLRTDCSRTDLGNAIAFDDDGGVDAYSSLVLDLEPGRYFLVVDAYREENGAGSYELRITTPQGHAVLIGHDYFATNEDSEALLVNAVALVARTNPVVSGYSEFADTPEHPLFTTPFPEPNGEAGVADGLIEAGMRALGREALITRFEDGTTANLERVLASTDVLLVYEQELGTPTTAANFRAVLPDFVARGGVVVVMDGIGRSAPLVDTATLIDTVFDRTNGLTTITGVTNQLATVVAPSDPVAEGLSRSYTAPSASCAYPGASGADVVVESAAGDPVVLHRTFR